MPEPRPGWGDRLWKFFLDRCESMWDKYGTFITKIPFLQGLRVIDLLIPADEKDIIPLFDAILAIPDVPETARKTIQRVKSFCERTEVPVNELVAILALKEVIAGYLSPVAVRSAYHMSAALAVARPDPMAAWTMHFRGDLPRETIVKQLRDVGWTEAMVDQFRKVAETLISTGEAIQLYWRGDYTVGALRTVLHRQGYPIDDAESIIKLTARIPGPPDLISMAVREAFHPELIAKYHYMDNFPGEFATYMAKQGFSREWAEKWWVAHWRLPSITSGFEMLHRGQISIGDLRDLLRTADIAPVWHDPLIAIAYQPYTRVDTRRMHALGILSDAELVRSYMDQGYDLEHAVNMAEFTILYNTSAEREATKADILKGYLKGLLSRQEATNALIDIGYPLHLATYYLSLEDLHDQEEINDEEIKTVEALYVNREIDQSQAHARLGALNLTATQISKLFERWDIARKRKIIRPGVADLESFYKDGIIGTARFESELANRGYLPEYVIWYRNSLLLEVEHEAQEEQDRAAKEAERIAAQVEKTAYQTAKAKIDYGIAQLQTQYAHLRNVLEQMIGADDRVRMGILIEESGILITQIQRDIAGKRTQLLIAKADPAMVELGVPDEIALEIARENETIAEERVNIASIQATLTIELTEDEMQSLIDRMAEIQVQIKKLQEERAGLLV